MVKLIKRTCINHIKCNNNNDQAKIVASIICTNLRKLPLDTILRRMQSSSTENESRSLTAHFADCFMQYANKTNDRWTNYSYSIMNNVIVSENENLLLSCLNERLERELKNKYNNECNLDLDVLSLMCSNVIRHGLSRALLSHIFASLDSKVHVSKNKHFSGDNDMDDSKSESDVGLEKSNLYNRNMSTSRTLSSITLSEQFEHSKKSKGLLWEAEALIRIMEAVVHVKDKKETHSLITEKLTASSSSSLHLVTRESNVKQRNEYYNNETENKEVCLLGLNEWCMLESWVERRWDELTLVSTSSTSASLTLLTVQLLSIALTELANNNYETKSGIEDLETNSKMENTTMNNDSHFTLRKLWSRLGLLQPDRRLLQERCYAQCKKAISILNLKYAQRQNSVRSNNYLTNRNHKDILSLCLAGKRVGEYEWQHKQSNKSSFTTNNSPAAAASVIHGVIKHLPSL